MCFSVSEVSWSSDVLFLCQVVANNHELHNTVLTIINKHIQQHPGNITVVFVHGGPKK